MILYSLDRKFSAKNMLFVYAGVTMFCLAFSTIYARYSHNVSSDYMTYFFVCPLLLGCVPALLLMKVSEIGKLGRISYNAYHSGVAALTVSSMLRGIFEIAGTSSEFQTYLTYAGLVMAGVGILFLLLEIGTRFMCRLR